MQNNKLRAVALARSWLSEKPVFLDTETTGIDERDQICDIAIVDVDGSILLNTLVKPTIPIPDFATQLHGITNDDVQHAPGFAEVCKRVASIVDGRRVVVYNRDFDARMIKQSAAACGLHLWQLPAGKASCCAMLLYAHFYGERAYRTIGYRWQRLGNAARQCGIELPEGTRLHRALTDAELCRRIVLHVASYQEVLA